MGQILESPLIDCTIGDLAQVASDMKLGQSISGGSIKRRDQNQLTADNIFSP